MIVYTLSGVLAPGLGQSTFLIPFFKRSGSNAVFAQELDGNYKIRRFMKINPENFENVSCYVPLIDKIEGHGAVMAFRANDGEPIIGEVQEITNILADYVIDNDRDFFFQIDVFSFLKDKEGVSKSIQLAQKNFTNAKMAKIWASGERAAALAKIDRDNIGEEKVKDLESNFSNGELELIIKQLIESPNATDWYDVWLEAYQKFQFDSGLLEVANWWVRSRSIDDEIVPSIIKDVLLYGEYNDEFINFIMFWLEEVKVHRMWVDVWCMTLDRGMMNGKWRGLLQDVGWRFIRIDPPATDYVSAGQWSKVWKAIRGRNENLEELVHIAANVFAIWHRSEIFLKSVVSALIKKKRIDDSSEGRRLMDIVRDWLLNIQKWGSAWCDIYALYLRQRPDDQEIIHYGRYLLRNRKLKQNSWGKVWKAIGNATGFDDELYEQAMFWLKTSNPNIMGWPDILNIVASIYGVGDDIRKLSIEWLRVSSPNHPKRRLIEALSQRLI
ncbi:hypothetical protein [Azospirillum argentinense]|uniref:hypothetical protein n=1 Tax=Azospirillum argentinense TaxID=2970906 RepID=UPI0010C09336|nr:hypothetical protein [Azospirillum argentinense]